MPSVKLTKTVIENAAIQENPYELRDKEVKGFYCVVRPNGRKIFFFEYRTLNRQRRKAAIGEYGAFKVQEAREVARRWYQEARSGGDPSFDRGRARADLTIGELCTRFMRDHSKLHNKPSTQRGYQQQIDQRILPSLGHKSIEQVERADIVAFMRDNAASPTQANRTLALLKKMFNCAELWGLRREGSNPCRLVQMYKTQPRTRLLSDTEVRKIFEALDRIDEAWLMAPVFTRACRLQFAFAARINEILNLEWEWVDFERRVIVWPDSKTGLMQKYFGDDVAKILKSAKSQTTSKYVCPSVRDANRPLCMHVYYSSGWKKILKNAGVAHCGTHHVRHRAATDIANAVDNVRTGMQMTGHKTVQMFMRYVHPEEERIRAAQTEISNARRAIMKRTA